MNSIIRSESVDGRVDVSSMEGVGTEIRITFDAAIPEDEPVTDVERIEILGRQATATLMGFGDDSKGTSLLREVLQMYLTSWWGFKVVENDEGHLGDILVVNENIDPLLQAIARKDARRPFILLVSERADAAVMAAMGEYERIGGFCRLVAKPMGPTRLRQVLKACVGMISFRDGSHRSSPTTISSSSSRANTLPIPTPSISDPFAIPASLSRRVSQETGMQATPRPRMGPRAHTFHPLLPTAREPIISVPSSPAPVRATTMSDDEQTVTIGTGGTLLKSSIGTLDRRGRINILIVEDNEILRNLLYVLN